MRRRRVAGRANPACAAAPTGLDLLAVPQRWRVLGGGVYSQPEDSPCLRRCYENEVDGARFDVCVRLERGSTKRWPANDTRAESGEAGRACRCNA